MTTLAQYLLLDKMKLPPAPARGLLAYLHSGDILRQALPSLLRIGAALWLIVQVSLWLALWSPVYREFERWGLVKAFFAQLIMLATVLLVTRITFLRAEHLQALPADDFVILRALSVVCRMLGEVALVYVVGSGLSSFLQPVSALVAPLVGSVSPAAAQKVAAGSTEVLLVSAPFTLVFIGIVAAVFLFLYSAANAIDVYLAIEFNTRAEKLNKRIAP